MGICVELSMPQEGATSSQATGPRGRVRRPKGRVCAFYVSRSVMEWRDSGCNGVCKIRDAMEDAIE